MILLLGATGYVGSAFKSEICKRGLSADFLSRKHLDYTRFDNLYQALRHRRPSFLINAAGFVGRPNVDACEDAKSETIKGCVLFPQMVAHACLEAKVPWGHVSSGCIYSGVHKSGRGFNEDDDPNFSFRSGPCSFYSGAKALCEEVIREIGTPYIWRLRIPFNNVDHPRNFLTKVMTYPKVYDARNSLSHLGDFVSACLDLWHARAPFGTYNVTNPGHITTSAVVSLIRKTVMPNKEFQFWNDDYQFYAHGAKAPRSSCILSTAKLQAAGIKMRDVTDAVMESLKTWKK